MNISASRSVSTSSSGYSVARKKIERIASLLRSILILIGGPTQQPGTLEMGNGILPGWGLTNDAAILVDCVAHLRQGIFRVPVMGTFNAGKSSLLNALLGVRMFPAYPLPTTAVMTNLVFGECNEVIIYEEDKKHPHLISWEVFTNHFILSKADIDTIDTQGRITSRLKSIKSARVESHQPFLANGIRLIDTPGLGVNSDHASMAEHFLKQPETALLFVLNATNPFSKDVVEFLATAFGSQCQLNVFFVINRMDQIHPTMVDTLKRNVRHILWPHFLDGNAAFDHDLYARRVFFVSAKAALEARIESPEDWATLEISGIPALEKELEQFLTSSERLLSALESLLQPLHSIVDRACRRIAEKKPMPHKSGKLNANFSAENEGSRLDLIESELQELLQMVNIVAAGEDPATHSADQIEPAIATFPPRSISTQHDQFSAPPISRRRTKKLQLDEPDPFEVGIDIDDHLQFVEQITERYDLPYHEHADLHESIKQIRRRRADTNLYMAVVGEFSSGKSTFINALLRQKLLKASVLPTTANAVRLHYGPKLDVSVSIEDQEKPLRYLEASAQLWQFIRSCNPKRQGIPSDIREFIRLVTTEGSIASRINDLVIYHPASFLADGIVIIDTPGTNALSDRHAQVTYQLIQQQADAAVIIIPGPLLSLSLKEFISIQLRPFLHRSLFVVTQMDKIPEEEQEQVIEYLHHSITNDLEIHQPIVIYQAAAQVALNALGENKVVRHEIEHWQDRFTTLENTLWDRLRRERTLSIAERLVRLMTRLFEQLDNHLRECQAGYETRQIDLDQRINAYNAHLQSATESTISRHRHELQYLYRVQEGVQSDLGEIERRREVLHQKQLRLAAIVI